MRVIACILLPLVAAACSSTYRKMSADEKVAHLAELERTTLAELVELHPEVREDLDRAVGYAIFSKTATKVPFVGTGDGIGVVVSSATGKRTYLKVKRFDVGGGLGVRKYRLVIIFFSEEALAKLASGKLEFRAGMEASTGKGGVGGSRKEDYALYLLTEAGVSATWTVRLIRYSVLDLGE